MRKFFIPCHSNRYGPSKMRFCHACASFTVSTHWCLYAVGNCLSWSAECCWSCSTSCGNACGPWSYSTCSSWLISDLQHLWTPIWYHHLSQTIFWKMANVITSQQYQSLWLSRVTKLGQFLWHWLVGPGILLEMGLVSLLSLGALFVIR